MTVAVHVPTHPISFSMRIMLFGADRGEDWPFRGAAALGHSGVMGSRCRAAVLSGDRPAGHRLQQRYAVAGAGAGPRAATPAAEPATAAAPAVPPSGTVVPSATRPKASLSERRASERSPCESRRHQADRRHYRSGASDGSDARSGPAPEPGRTRRSGIGAAGKLRPVVRAEPCRRPRDSPPRQVWAGNRTTRRRPPGARSSSPTNSAAAWSSSGTPRWSGRCPPARSSRAASRQ